MAKDASMDPLFTIEDLPDEVLEFILGLLPPYKDLHDCLLVSKRWRRCVYNVCMNKQRNLKKAIDQFNISWQSPLPVNATPTITKRYSHAAAVHGNSMYVFGGCTCSMTTFNDLWRLDLSTREWVRPLTMGAYPSPKACCSMVCYKDNLVLFGGWTYPAMYPLHQTWHLFNELHLYDIAANTWVSLNAENNPPPTAGHSVSVHGEWMVIFGGLQRESNVVHSTKSNDVWKLNLQTWTWFKQEPEGRVKPAPRFGHSQTVLDGENILIMGGTGGPSVYYSDVWVLNMKGPVWRWIQMEVRNGNDAPPNLWCNPVCKVGDKVIVLSRSRYNNTPPLMYYSKGVWIPPREETKPNPSLNARDENVNGKRGSLKGLKTDEPEVAVATQSQPGPSRNRDNKTINNPIPSTAFNAQPFKASRTDQRRERRLESLLRVEAKLKNQMRETQQQQHAQLCIVPEPKKQKKNVLGMYVLDVSRALDAVQPYVTWLPLKNEGAFTQGPEETVLYSLVAGKSELIMFGGIQKEATALACMTTNLSNQVTNALHFIAAPKYII